MALNEDPQSHCSAGLSGALMTPQLAYAIVIVPAVSGTGTGSPKAMTWIVA
jgi:hypothetical protein